MAFVYAVLGGGRQGTAAAYDMAKFGDAAQVQLDLIDRYDEATGFTAMERTTGWDASIKTIMNAQRVTPRGVNPAEIAVPGLTYVAELRRRGFSLTETFTTIKP